MKKSFVFLLSILVPLNVMAANTTPDPADCVPSEEFNISISNTSGNDDDLRAIKTKVDSVLVSLKNTIKDVDASGYISNFNYTINTNQLGSGENEKVGGKIIYQYNFDATITSIEKQEKALKLLSLLAEKGYYVSSSVSKTLCPPSKP